MSFNVAMLKAMETEGLDLAACIRVLEACGPDTAADKRRAYDRERKAEKRAEEKSGGMSGGSPPDPAPNERDNLTPTRETKTKAEALSKSLVAEEKRQAIASCLRVAFPCPDGVSAEQWTAFRKQRKKALNERSYLLLCNKLTALADAGWPPGDMIDLAIERGWETVFEPRTAPNGNVTSLQRNRPNLTALLRASSGDPESGFGTRPALPASGNG